MISYVEACHEAAALGRLDLGPVDVRAWKARWQLVRDADRHHRDWQWGRQLSIRWCRRRRRREASKSLLTKGLVGMTEVE